MHYYHFDDRCADSCKTGLHSPTRGNPLKNIARTIVCPRPTALSASQRRRPGVSIAIYAIEEAPRLVQTILLYFEEIQPVLPL